MSLFYMSTALEKYLELNKLFKQHGYKLYLVGGFVRDHLLNIDTNDIDIVSDATPDEIIMFMPQVDTTFIKYGTTKFKYNGNNFDVVSFRKEENYFDARHPEKISFVKDIKVDVVRRDFTINGLYMDENLKVLDFVGGVNDLDNKIIRCIGDADIRIKEDALRILRALRFSLDYDFEIENSLKDAINKYKNNLENISKDKIKQELKKIKCKDFNRIKSLFEKFSILNVLDMLE